MQRSECELHIFAGRSGEPKASARLENGRPTGSVTLTPQELNVVRGIVARAESAGRASESGTAS